MELRVLFRNDCERLCEDDHLRDFKCKVLCLKEKNILRWLYFSFLKQFGSYTYCSFCLGFGHLSRMHDDKLVLTNI